MAFRNYSTDWRIKSFAFNLFDRAPAGGLLYYMIQRYVTGTVPRDFDKYRETYIKHCYAAAEKFGDVARLKVLEIGAGWDLYGNILNYTYGFNDQTVMDVRKLARAQSVNEVIEYFQKNPIQGCVRSPSHFVSEGNFEDDLLQKYGIRYLAPCDATAFQCQDREFNMIITTSVFEHIPRDVLEKIILNFHRVLSDDGICSHVVDFSDHYSHSDKKISSFNYCKFPEVEWRRHSPAIHYQNRMRHGEYVDLFRRCGFGLVREQCWSAEEEELRGLPLHEDFARFDKEDLLKLGSHFIVVKAAGSGEGDLPRFWHTPAI